MKNRFLLLFFLLLSFAYADAQVNPQNDLQDFNQRRINLNKQGMIVLGSWALSNMAISSLRLGAANPEVKAYHQMNLGWNAVNLVIAGFGVYNSLNANENLQLAESILEQNKISKILLFNAALDIGYMLGGAYLLERAKNDIEQRDRLRGFGKAVIVNGAFLLVFDSILYYMHAQNETNTLIPILKSIELGPQSVGLRLNF